MNVTTLECTVTCDFAGGGHVSAAFQSLSLEFRFQVACFRLWVASASDGGGSKPPVVSAGGNVTAVIVANSSCHMHAGSPLQESEHMKLVDLHHT
jgi:hypothetical protein